MKNKPLYEQAKEQLNKATNRTPHNNDWGMFIQQPRFKDGDPCSGSFFWFPSEQDLIDNIINCCIYWLTIEPNEKIHRNTLKNIKKHITDYTQNTTTQNDLIFRINNILVPAGTEITWFGPFTKLLFDNDEIPRRTRLFCRQTLADMEDHTVNPLSDAPIEPQILNTYIECLNDFGLYGQGL